MAEIKWDDIVNKVGEKIVNEYIYKDKPLREWIDLIVDYEPNKMQEPKTDYKSFAEWVAGEIFTESWEYNKDSFAEIACRKLEKLGIVASEGDAWKLKESEVEDGDRDRGSQ